MKRFSLFSLFCLLACTALFSMGCTHTPVQKTFPQEYRLTSSHLPLHTVQVEDMEITNGFLVLQMRNASIEIYSAENYSFKHAFEGPRRSTPHQMTQIVKSSSPFLYIGYPNSDNEIRKYQIDSLGQPNLLQSGYSGISTSMNRPYLIRDSLILFDEFVPEASLKIRNLHTNSTELALPYGTTSLEERFWDKNMGGLYANDSCIAFVYKYQDRIDFYDWQFNLIHGVNHQISEPVIYQRETLRNKTPDNVLYYGFSFMGQNYFYTLYRGVSNRVFRSDSLLVNKNLNIYCYGITRDVLEVYDLDGQPVCRFRFDDVSPGVFVVDEEQNRLLGYRDADQFSLLVYQLQGLPKNGKKHIDAVKISHSLPSTPKPAPYPYSDVIQVRWTSSLPDVQPTYVIYIGGGNNRFTSVIETGMIDKIPAHTCILSK